MPRVLLVAILALSSLGVIAQAPPSNRPGHFGPTDAILMPRSGQWLALRIGCQDAPGSSERPRAHLSHLGTSG